MPPFALTRWQAMLLAACLPCAAFGASPDNELQRLRQEIEDLRRSQQILVVRGAAHGDDVRMLDDQQLIRNLSALTALDKLLLQREGIGVTEQAEVAQLKDCRCHGDIRH